MLMMMEELREAGMRPRLTQAPRRSPVDLILEVEFKRDMQRFAVETRARAPYPSELDSLEPTFSRARPLGRPLLAAPFVSEGLGRALAARGWSWSDDAGNYELIGDRFHLARRTPAKEPRVKRNRRLLPQGPGALAIIRFLIVHGGDTPFGPTELANIAGVTQPRASQVLARLHDSDLMHNTANDPHAPDRGALLDVFLNEYRGPGGSEYALYSLDAPQQAAERLSKARGKPLLAVSADVGPDLVASWRAPTHLIVYTKRPINTTALGLTPAHDRGDANILLRVPGDSSVFADRHPMVAQLGDSELRLVDATQMIWDLHDLGGDDRVEAAAELKSWILRTR